MKIVNLIGIKKKETLMLSTEVTAPTPMNTKLIRQILQNNPSLSYNGQVTECDKFIPHLLVGLGMFPSTSEVRRNRPDLWREKAPYPELVTIGRIHLTIL